MALWIPYISRLPLSWEKNPEDILAGILFQAYYLALLKVMKNLRGHVLLILSASSKIVPEVLKLSIVPSFLCMCIIYYFTNKQFLQLPLTILEDYCYGKIRYKIRVRVVSWPACGINNQTVPISVTDKWHRS